MVWTKRPRAAVLDDIRALVTPGWDVARARIGYSRGGAVTLTILNVRRTDGGTGTQALLTLPARLAPTDHLYGIRTYRGKDVQLLASGQLSIVNPETTVIDHLSLTFVPMGGA